MALSAALLSIAAADAAASNGTNVIGFGHESFGIGGADIAYITDTAAVAVNPAGLVGIERRRMDLHAAFSDASQVSHADGFGNEEANRNSPVPFAGGGFAWRFNDRLVAGFATLVQGGSGVEYRNLNTAFGTRDDLKNLFGIVKLASGVGYRYSDRLSLGASLELLYTSLEQEVFANTSAPDPLDPSQSFFGYRIDDASNLSAGLRLGMRYRVNERLTLGLAGATGSDIRFEDAGIRLDYSGLGLGQVNYDADLKGLEQPAEVGVGLSYRVSDALVVNAELNWINWSAAYDSSTLTATRPDNALAPATVTQVTRFNWDDQYVWSAGAVYRFNDRLTVRAGFNHADNPVPDDTLNPLFPLIAETHLTLGAGYRLNGEWALNGTLVHDMRNRETYTNNAAPFGTDAEADYSIWFFMATLSRTW